METRQVPLQPDWRLIPCVLDQKVTFAWAERISMLFL